MEDCPRGKGSDLEAMGEADAGDEEAGLVLDDEESVFLGFED